MLIINILIFKKINNNVNNSILFLVLTFCLFLQYTQSQKTFASLKEFIKYKVKDISTNQKNNPKNPCIILPIYLFLCQPTT